MKPTKTKKKFMNNIKSLFIGIFACSIVLFVAFIVVSPIKQCDCSNPITEKCIDYCNLNTLETLSQPPIPSWVILVIMIFIIIGVIVYIYLK